MGKVAIQIGKRIRALREGKAPHRRRGQGRKGHMTIAELATATGLSPATVNKIELGYKAPRVESLLSLASALGCEPGELLPAAKRTSKRWLLDAWTRLTERLIARGVEPGTLTDLLDSIEWSGGRR